MTAEIVALTMKRAERITRFVEKANSILDQMDLRSIKRAIAALHSEQNAEQAKEG